MFAVRTMHFLHIIFMCPALHYFYVSSFSIFSWVQFFIIPMWPVFIIFPWPVFHNFHVRSNRTLGGGGINLRRTIIEYHKSDDPVQIMNWKLFIVFALRCRNEEVWPMRFFLNFRYKDTILITIMFYNSFYSQRPMGKDRTSFINYQWKASFNGCLLEAISIKAFL